MLLCFCKMWQILSQCKCCDCCTEWTYQTNRVHCNLVRMNDDPAPQSFAVNSGTARRSPGSTTQPLDIASRLEMCGNGFQHSHSLPFPYLFNSHSLPSHSQFFDLFPFPWDSRVGYSHSLAPIPILSMVKLYIISDTVIIILCS